jgi:hypothetical protein
MRYLNILSIALILSTGSLAVSARGQERPGTSERHCQKILHSSAAKLQVNFQALDTNHDGVLSQKETQAQNLPSMCFDKLDHDRNQALSVDELSMS